MKRILLVDDESLARQHIKTAFPWEAWGAEIVGEASNGEEALQLCEELRPDVALLDITMPIMDGLTLLNLLKTRCPRTRCIILTAHRDFDYAQQAIASGAFGYILKSPVDLAAAKTALDRAFTDIEKDSALNENISKHRQLIRNYQYPLRKEFFENVLTGVLSSPQEIAERGDALGVHLRDNAFLLTVWRIEQLHELTGKYAKKDLPLIEFSMLEIIRETLQIHADGHFEMFPREFGELIVLFSSGQDRISPALAAEWLDLCREPLRQYMSIRIAAAASEPFHSVSAIRKEYNQACKLLEHRFYAGEAKTLFHRSVAPFQHVPDDKWRELEAGFEKAWAGTGGEGGAGSAGREPNKWKDWLLAVRNVLMMYTPHPDQVKGWLQERFNGLQEPLRSRMSGVLRHDACLERILQTMDGIATEWMKEETEKRRIRPDIAAAVHYIKTHLDQDLTLESIAKEAQLSVSHLCFLFKKEIGTSVVDYILDQRIEAAKSYLRNGQYRNYELASRVGFHNYSYFCTTFKKHTGMTPNEYKQANKPFVST